MWQELVCYWYNLDWEDIMEECRALYRPKEAAAILGVSEKQVRVLVKAGKLPGTKVGGQVRISREAVEKIVERAGGGE